MKLYLWCDPYKDEMLGRWWTRGYFEDADTVHAMQAAVPRRERAAESRSKDWRAALLWARMCKRRTPPPTQRRRKEGDEGRVRPRVPKARPRGHESLQGSVLPRVPRPREGAPSARRSHAAARRILPAPRVPSLQAQVRPQAQRGRVRRMGRLLAFAA